MYINKSSSHYSFKKLKNNIKKTLFSKLEMLSILIKLTSIYCLFILTVDSAPQNKLNKCPDGFVGKNCSIGIYLFYF